MSIHIELHPPGAQATITFTLAQDPELPVSVVGSFNDWNPASNPLLPDESGSRSTSVTLDTTHDVYFRYLGSGGAWFDEPEADELTTEGSVLHLSRRAREPGSATEPGRLPPHS